MILRICFLEMLVDLLDQVVQRFEFVGWHIFRHEKIGVGVKSDQGHIFAGLEIDADVSNQDRQNLACSMSFIIRLPSRSPRCCARQFRC